MDIKPEHWMTGIFILIAVIGIVSYLIFTDNPMFPKKKEVEEYVEQASNPRTYYVTDGLTDTKNTLKLNGEQEAKRHARYKELLKKVERGTITEKENAELGSLTMDSNSPGTISLNRAPADKELMTVLEGAYSPGYRDRETSDRVFHIAKHGKQTYEEIAEGVRGAKRPEIKSIDQKYTY